MRKIGASTRVHELRTAGSWDPGRILLQLAGHEIFSGKVRELLISDLLVDFGTAGLLARLRAQCGLHPSFHVSF